MPRDHREKRLEERRFPLSDCESSVASAVASAVAASAAFASAAFAYSADAAAASSVEESFPAGESLGRFAFDFSFLGDEVVYDLNVLR